MFLQSRAEISSCTVPALCLLKLLPFFALTPLPPLSSTRLFRRSFSSLSFFSSSFTRTTLSLRGGGGGEGSGSSSSEETRCINYQYGPVLASNIRSLHFRLPCLSRAPAEQTSSDSLLPRYFVVPFSYDPDRTTESKEDCQSVISLAFLKFLLRNLQLFLSSVSSFDGDFSIFRKTTLLFLVVYYDLISIIG